jgi:hypothetical protein
VRYSQRSRRTFVVNICLREVERDIVVAAAEAAELPLSVYARETLIAASRDRLLRLSHGSPDSLPSREA